MTNIIYVNEYQPSSAHIKLGDKPIYRQSSESEIIRVTTPTTPILAVIGLITGVGLIIYALTSE